MTRVGVDQAPLGPAVGDDLPAPWVANGMIQRIHDENRRVRRRIAVLDDDPTGSQTVHDVQLVTSVDRDEIAAALASPSAACFVLTNTRSQGGDTARALNRAAASILFDLAGEDVDIVSRGDSTLRGHLMAEVCELDRVRRQRFGRGCDGVLFVPAYFEAGRFTVDDVHYAEVDGNATPVAETEFARDTTFGYSESNLRDFLAACSGGSMTRDHVQSLGLREIRSGGPDYVAERLRALEGGTFTVVNALEYADLEVVVLGLQSAQRSGKRYLYRSGPSFVRALTGIKPQPPLSSPDVWPERPSHGHGLVVVGSHTELTNRQLRRSLMSHPLESLELDVTQVLTPSVRGRHLADLSARASAGLHHTDVVISTSRAPLGRDGERDPLAIARAVSDALSELVATVRSSRPSWVIAKGGITSHDVATAGLGIRRARVIGQLMDGMVTVIRPIVAAPEAIGIPYVIFAGNVGDESTLAAAIGVMKGGGDA